MTKTKDRFGILKLGTRPQGGESKRSADNFGHCYLFDIWDLEFLLLHYSSILSFFLFISVREMRDTLTLTYRDCRVNSRNQTV